MFKKPIINTFVRQNIPYQALSSTPGTFAVANRFTGQSVQATALLAYLVEWVYQVSDSYEQGDYSVKVSDFDRVRYFVLNQDPKVYDTCLD